MKKGFTLVELSIVLVIIGLLIGGILVAQSMISTSKITAQVSQFQQFDAAVMSFKSAYKFLPGDAVAFGGDADGIIDIGPLYAVNYVSILGCEHANFWNSLMPEKYARVTCGAPSGPMVTSGTSKNVPVSKLGKPGSFVAVSAVADAGNDRVTNPATVRNYYMIMDPSQGTTINIGFYRAVPTDSTNSAVSPADLLALDTKIDDGVANNGDVMAGKISTMWSLDVNTPPAACSTTTTYNLANKTYECTPMVRIGSEAGDLQ